MSTENCTSEAFFNMSDVNVTICSAKQFTDDEFTIMDTVTMVCGSLSMIGSAFIITTFAVFKDLRVPSLKLVMFLSCTDFVQSVTYTMSAIENHNPHTCERYPVCFVQAGMTEFAELAGFFWVGCIAFNIYAIAVLRMNERQVNLQHRYYHICSWGVPAVLTIIGYAGDYYGPAGSWCWVQAQHFVARIMLLYFWLIALLVLVTYLYCHVAFAVRGSSLSIIVGRLRLYVFIFVGCHIFGLVNRIQNFVDPCSPIFWLSFLQAFFASLQGLANAIAYGLNRSVINQYKRCLRKSRLTSDFKEASTELSPPNRVKLHESLRTGPVGRHEDTGRGHGGSGGDRGMAEVPSGTPGSLGSEADYGNLEDGHTPDFGYSSDEGSD